MPTGDGKTRKTTTKAQMEDRGPEPGENLVASPLCTCINLIKNFNHILLLQNTSGSRKLLLMPITFAAQRKLNKNIIMTRPRLWLKLRFGLRVSGVQGGGAVRSRRQTNISKIILNICSWHVGQTTFDHFAEGQDRAGRNIRCECVRCMWKPFCDITKY